MFDGFDGNELVSGLKHFLCNRCLFAAFWTSNSKTNFVKYVPKANCPSIGNKQKLFLHFYGTGAATICAMTSLLPRLAGLKISTGRWFGKTVRLRVASSIRMFSARHLGFGTWDSLSASQKQAWQVLGVGETTWTLDGSFSKQFFEEIFGLEQDPVDNFGNQQTL